MLRCSGDHGASRRVTEVTGRCVVSFLIPDQCAPGDDVTIPEDENAARQGELDQGSRRSRSSSPTTAPLSDGFLTRDNTLTVTGKGQPGSKVVLFDKGEKIGVATVGGDGKWSIDTGRLGDGDHDFTAKAKFGDRASKVSKPVKGEVDTTAPGKPATPDLAAASDTGSSSADNHTGDNTPTLTGTAEAGATVAIFDGATVLGTTIAERRRAVELHAPRRWLTASTASPPSRPTRRGTRAPYRRLWSSRSTRSSRPGRLFLVPSRRTTSST